MATQPGIQKQLILDLMGNFLHTAQLWENVKTNARNARRTYERRAFELGTFPLIATQEVHALGG